MSLSSKLPQVGTTIFTTMSSMAKEAGAINLAQGFPGFSSDPELLDLVRSYTKAGYNQYAPMMGIPELRQKISEKTLLTQAYSPHPDTEVTVVSGATEALFAAIAAVVSLGDEVILLNPAYDSYAPAVILNGGVPVYAALRDKDYAVDWDEILSKVSPATRAIVVNTPHNPSGYVWTKEDVKQLADLVDRTGIYVISDEVYEHITFDDRNHICLGSHPGLRSHTFVCGSFGKTFHVTGWKIGYCIAPVSLMVEFRKIHQYLTFSTVSPMQYALASYLEDKEKYLSLPNFYQKKRDDFVEGLEKTPFKFQSAAGSFFQWVSYAHLSDMSDFELATRMTKELKVACIPFSVFYSDQRDLKRLRFCFAKEKQELDLAVERLCRIHEILV